MPKTKLLKLPKGKEQSKETKKLFGFAVSELKELSGFEERSRIKTSNTKVGGRECSCDRCPRGGKCGKH